MYNSAFQAIFLMLEWMTEKIWRLREKSLDSKKYGFLQKSHFNKLHTYKEMFWEWALDPVYFTDTQFAIH